MSFDCVEGNEKLIGNFLVGEAFGHELQHFVLTFADADGIYAALIKLKGGIGNDNGLLSGEL